MFLNRFQSRVRQSSQRQLHTTDWRKLVQTLRKYDSDDSCSTPHMLGRQRYSCSSLPARHQAGSNGLSSYWTPVGSRCLSFEGDNRKSSFGTMGHIWWYSSTFYFSNRNEMMIQKYLRTRSYSNPQNVVKYLSCHSFHNIYIYMYLKVHPVLCVCRIEFTLNTASNYIFVYEMLQQMICISWSEN